MLVFMTLNMVDVGLLIIREMQVDNAAEMAAQSMYSSCKTATVPAFTNCTDYAAKITTAVQSTSLGSAVTGTPAEKHCCAKTADGTLSCAAYDASRTSCSALGGDAATAPGYYVEIITTYLYTPMFGSVSVLAGNKTLTSTATIRLK